MEYELRLAMTLCYMAGGSYLDLMYLFGVKKSSLYAIMWQTLEQLDTCTALPDLTLERDVNDQQRCRALAAGFVSRTRCTHVTGCIGALDGMALKIEQPTTSDNPLKYFCRKLFNAVSVQAVCDSDRRFLYMDMSQAGSTHDSTAWNAARTLDGSDRMGLLMASSRVLSKGCPILAPYGFFLVADDAYRCCHTIMAPWSGAPFLTRERTRPCLPVPTQPSRAAPAGAGALTDTAYEDSFNHQLSRARINIECAFGMLMNKFLIFARPLPWVMFKSPTRTDDYSKPLLLLRVAMKIHNACIDQNLEEDPVRASDFFGGYDTPTARAGRTHRGQAQTDPPLSSGRTHPDGSPAEPPIWSEEDAEAALPPAYVQKNKSKARDVQINDVCKARVHLTNAVANAGPGTGPIQRLWQARCGRQSAPGLHETNTVRGRLVMGEGLGGAQTRLGDWMRSR